MQAQLMPFNTDQIFLRSKFQCKSELKTVITNDTYTDFLFFLFQTLDLQNTGEHEILLVLLYKRQNKTKEWRLDIFHCSCNFFFFPFTCLWMFMCGILATTGV